MEVRIESSWKRQLNDEFTAPYFINLSKRVEAAHLKNTVYPAPHNVFRAFELCPFDTVQVVILGQDPYHGPGQAHGLAFSVPGGMKIPPSLQNIYTEIRADVGKLIHNTGNLERWAAQGVLLLNTTLTVAADTPGSHSSWGWERFTDAVIRSISTKRKHVVFLLWGKHAGAKTALVDPAKHLVLKAPHPSPLSAYRGFFGCGHFSKTNEYLQNHHLSPIEW